ncbi:MAG: polyprenyl synthetase family protein [Dehalococcoidales bacterium]
MRELTEITQSVREDLAAVEASLKSLSEVEPRDLSELLHYSLSGGGKRIRPTIALLSAKFYDYDLERMMPLVTAVELMHLATLVHDDTIDDSSVRWGRPTVNSIWGTEQAVLLGDYLFAQAGKLVTTTGNIRVIRMLSETLMVISSGEITQARSAFNLDQSRDDYLRRVTSKTASLFTLASEAGAVLSRAPERSVRDLRDYAHNLGIAFQVVDDILDFVGTEEEMGKPVGSDLAQGTLTLPAMLLLEDYPEDNPVRLAFRQKDGREHVDRTIEMIRNSTIIDRCFDVAADYRERACRCLDRFPDNASRRALIGLTEFVVERRR